MLKKAVLFTFFLLGFGQNFAQTPDKKYRVGIYLGMCYNLGIKGPKTPTEVSPVKFTTPYAKTFGFSFDMKLPNKYFIGFEGFYDEFDAGYRGGQKEQLGGVGVISGSEHTWARIALYKGGIRFGKSFVIYKRLMFNAALVPSFAFSFWDNDLVDTALDNSNQRFENLPAGQAIPYQEVLYYSYPSYQNTGLHVVIKSIAEIQYTFRNNVGISVGVAYQQGFRPFVVDTVNIIRQYELNTPQHKYWTRFSGTSVQFHFGVKYDF